jgi:hypothetical protein
MLSFANKIRTVTHPNLRSLPISARWSRSPLPPLVGRCVPARGAGSTLQPGVGALMSGRALGGVAGSSLTVEQVFAVADATRRRIERDLHDGLQQQLVSLALRVRAVEAMVPAELVELRAELSRVVDEHTNLLDQLREIAHGIHPATLSENGLERALKTLARRSPIPVELKVRVDARLPEEVELAAYYVVAEALTNTAKYSHASLVDVLVQTRGRPSRRRARRRCGRGRPGAGYGLARPQGARRGNRRHRLASQPSGFRHVARRGASPRRKITTPSARPATSWERRAQQRLGTGLLKPSSTRLCGHHRRQSCSRLGPHRCLHAAIDLIRARGPDSGPAAAPGVTPAGGSPLGAGSSLRSSRGGPAARGEGRARPLRGRPQGRPDRADGRRDHAGDHARECADLSGKRPFSRHV